MAKVVFNENSAEKSHSDAKASAEWGFIWIVCDEVRTNDKKYDIVVLCFASNGLKGLFLPLVAGGKIAFLVV